MKISELLNKSVLLAGYGVEGRATERFLKKYVPTARVSITDKTVNPELFAKQNEYDVVIKSPGIPKRMMTHPTYTTATNIFFANTSNKTIGVTGTKGKSTTTSLISHIFNANGVKAHLGGNIGVPMLDMYSELSNDDLVVCELSSYQLDDIAYAPTIRVIINLFPDHIPYHESLNAYYNAKRNILRYPQPDDWYIYNPQFSLLREWANDWNGRSAPYPHRDIPMDQYPLQGEHNADNIRAALAVTHIFGIGYDQACASVKTFTPLPHRLEPVGEFRGIMFYDDAISTTPESTIAALRSISSVATIMLGGEDRGYDFSDLVTELKKRNIANVVLFPDSGPHIRQEMERHAYYPVICETSLMEEAVAFAYTHTPKNMICMLSTASPSYSIWKNFEEKGSLFQYYIRAYATQKEALTQNGGSTTL